MGGATPNVGPWPRWVMTAPLPGGIWKAPGSPSSAPLNELPPGPPRMYVQSILGSEGPSEEACISCTAAFFPAYLPLQAELSKEGLITLNHRAGEAPPLDVSQWLPPLRSLPPRAYAGWKLVDCPPDGAVKAKEMATNR